MSGLSEQGWQNQIQALEATLAEMQERGRKAEQQRDAYLDGREMQRARAERAEAEVARLKGEVEQARKERDQAMLEYAFKDAPTATPPVDPRRVVGAVVRGVCGGDYIVMREGSGITQSLLKTDCQVPVWATLDGDAFLRWATPEECARHGIPYVARDGSDQPATHQEVDGILGGAGADLRALRDAFVDAMAAERSYMSNVTDSPANLADHAAHALRLAKQGEVGRA